LVKLANGEIDEANELLFWRNAAFHNFRTHEAMAERAGVDVAKDSETIMLWRAIAQVDRELEEAIEESKQKLAAELTQTRHIRNKLSKFHSGFHNHVRFRSTV